MNKSRMLFAIAVMLLIAGQQTLSAQTNDPLDKWSYLVPFPFASPPTELLFAKGSYFARTPFGVYSSPDGLEWSGSGCPIDAAKVVDTEFGVVAVGLDRVPYSYRYPSAGPKAAVAITQDGKTWTRPDLNIGSNRFYDAASGNGLLVISGSLGAYATINPNDDSVIWFEEGRVLITTTNGISWQVTKFPSMPAFSVLYFYKGAFWARAANQTFSSTNGHDWVAMVGQGNIRAATQGNGWFVSSPGVRSKDGLIWEDTPVQQTNVRLPVSITFANGIFLAVPNGVIVRDLKSYSAKFWSSLDGVDWKEHLVDAYGGILSVAFDGRRYIALTHPGGHMWTTEDIPRPRLTLRSRSPVGPSAIGISIPDELDYDLECSQDLSTWQVVNHLSKGANEISIPMDTTVTPNACFFRVRRR